MTENAPVMPLLSPIAGKPVQVAFDRGRLTSDAGVLLLAEIERRLGLAERLARCLADPRDPERARHTVAEMIRFRALLFATALGAPVAKLQDRATKARPEHGRLPGRQGLRCLAH